MIKTEFTQMKIVCPFCGYDHEDEVWSDTDTWASDVPYETECLKCNKNFIVHTTVLYCFSTYRPKAIETTKHPSA
jgi:ribosomal protein L32